MRKGDLSMSNFLNGMKSTTNYTRTENGALTHTSTMNSLLDLFAMGAAYRTRTDEDVILLFKNAFAEDPTYALKCLFYIRDVRGGQGERRFFRVVTKWLAKYDTAAMQRNLIHVPEFGRWDDLFVFIGTPLENEALSIVKHQLALDAQCKTPSLLAKWMPSENTSSVKTVKTAKVVRKYLGMTPKQYRKVLSALRKRINVLERLMSEGRWDEIEFDKIPSKAGLKYKNAFARHDIERMKRNPEVKSYADFAKDTTTKVNAEALYPYEVVDKATKVMGCSYWGHSAGMDDTDRLMVNKYWENLADYFNGKTFNGLTVVDTSASMRGSDAAAPINVAISLGMYCAERAKGPFAGHYVSFSSRPQLIAVEGADFCDKVARIWRTNLCENTNIEATFDMLLNTAIRNHCTQEDLPQNIIVISDMEFDRGTGHGYGYGYSAWNPKTLMESIREKWANHGYRLPHLIYWNVQARQNNIPEDIGCGLVSYVSGMSPSIFEQILSGKTGIDLMLEKLDSPRYEVIR
jgi:hypothetical protein